MNRVVARAVSKMWTATAGLRPIDLDVASGELVVVRGRSGSGKSTLLALLAGLTAPDGGTLEIEGRAPVADEPWSRIAMVPQVLALAIELSVRENVTDALVAPDDVAVDALLVDLGLADEARRSVAEISMGQQQRTALARALAAHPLLVLADEPTSFQDGGHAASVVTALRREAERGAAVVIATHDVAVVAAADRVLDLSPD